LPVQVAALAHNCYGGIYKHGECFHSTYRVGIYFCRHLLRYKIHTVKIFKNTKQNPKSSDNIACKEILI